MSDDFPFILVVNEDDLSDSPRLSFVPFSNLDLDRTGSIIFVDFSWFPFEQGDDKIMVHIKKALMTVIILTLLQNMPKGEILKYLTVYQ